LVRKAVLLWIAVVVALSIVSSFLVIELARLNEELIALKRERGEYWYDSDWVTRFVGYNPITSAGQAEEIYLMLINKAPHRSYWIMYLLEDKCLPLTLEASEMQSYYKVNGTFRNYAVNCPNARLTIVYSVFENGTAKLENVKTICPEYEHQEYP
jgi:hypothetical protein